MYIQENCLMQKNIRQRKITKREEKKKERKKDRKKERKKRY